MTRSKITVLCEDKQQEAFIRRFFKKRNREIYAVPRSKTSAGSGEQSVRNKYPDQLDAIRKRGGILVVMIDGDGHRIDQRQKHLDDACKQKGISPRKSSDKVVVFVPMRNIETWLAYLDSKHVDETVVYPKRKRQRECRRHVDVLDQMCAAGKLQSPAPASLEAACCEYNNFF